ncbi:MAG: hydrolase 2, exosortase A system-associated [Rubrivivax sp.]
MLPRPEAFFASPRPGRHAERFALWLAPAAAPRALVVHVHSWVEEMNKSRRMVALQSRAFAADGVAVLQMDRLGCGDSAGEHGDADWGGWMQDVLDACALARQRCARQWPGHTPPLWLWGLRTGCLLATEAAARLEQEVNLLLWQPVLQGKTALQQFLRTEAMASRLGKTGDAPGTPARQRLAAGETVTVAGYDIAPALAQGLEAARLQPPANLGRAVWIELASQADAITPPATVQAQMQWQQAGVELHAQRVIGPAFWQTTEIEDAPALIAATTAAIEMPTLVS